MKSRVKQGGQDKMKKFVFSLEVETVLGYPIHLWRK